ncbi:MAG: hypothetical protein OEZ32_00230 [Nitrospinota bacterium]|nr:hypothetical protein [Nitrospinota bacterium]
MNRKLFGKPMARSLMLAGLALVLAAGCVDKIPGDPDKELERYIKAVQESDYKTIFDINHVTARQLKFMRQMNKGDKERSLEGSYKQYKEIYLNVTPTFQIGITWAEKGFFPPGAQTKVGDPYYQVALEDDPVNAEYERATNVYVPVDVSYPDKTAAPEHDGKKVRSASYDCSMKKIREGQNVTVYSHDDKWFFGGCIVNMGKTTYHQ